MDEITLNAEIHFAWGFQYAHLSLPRNPLISSERRRVSCEVCLTWMNENGY